MPRVSNNPSVQPQTQSRTKFIETRLEELAAAVEKSHPSKSWTGAYEIGANAGPNISKHLSTYALQGVASTTMMSANVDFQLLQHSYGTGKPMYGFLEKMPKDGKLKLQLTITPSGHNGEANARKWSKENTYNARVGYMNGGRFVELAKTQFDGNGKETTQRTVQTGKENWAPTSPDLEVDLKQFKKDHPGKELVLEGWPNFSAGVGGYSEARRTIIDVNV